MNSFRRNAIFAVAGNFSTTGALAIILISMARLGTTEMVGRFSYALAICAPLFLLASLRLRDISSTEDSENYSVGDFFLVSLFTNTLALLAVVPSCWVLGLDGNTVWLAVFIGLWKIVTALSDIVYGHHQRSTQMKVVAGLQITHCVATVLTFVISFALTQSLILAVALVFLVNLMVFLACDFQTISFRDDDLFVKRGNMWRRIFSIVLVTLPLGLGGAVFSLNMVIPRALLEKSFSFEEVGVFAALAFFARLGTPVMQALGQTASASLARSVQKQDTSRFLNLLGKASALPVLGGVLLIAAGWYVGPQLLRIVYGPQYVVEPLAFVLIMVYATLVYVSTFLTYGLIAARRLKSQLVVLIVTILAILVCGLMLIPEYGVLGACLSLVVSAAVRLVGTCLVTTSIVFGFEQNLSKLPTNNAT